MKTNISIEDLHAHLLSQVERWCIAPANDENLQSLFNLRTQLALLEFIDVENQIRESYPELLENCAFSHFSNVATLPYEAVCRTLTHPVALLWSRKVHHQLQNLSNSQESLEKLKRHLNEFAPLTVATHVLSGQECEIKNIQLPGTFSLPGLGILVSHDNSRTTNIRVRNDSELITILIGDSNEDIEILADDRFPFPLRICGNLHVCVFPIISDQIPITLEYAEPVLRQHYHIVSGECEKIDESLWLDKLQNSFNLIQQVWPEMYEQLVASLLVIVPTSAGFCKQHSTGSDRDAWRSINTTLVPEPYFSDGIIHEHRHDLLNTLSFLEDIFAEGFEQVEAFYSPWRPEPRPPIGIFHAAFVFTSVAELYRRILLIPDCEIDVSREQLALDLGMQTIKLRIGIEELLATTKFSKFGNKMLEVLSTEAQKLHKDAQELGAFASSSTASQVRQHYETWCQKWHRLASTNVEAVISSLLS